MTDTIEMVELSPETIFPGYQRNLELTIAQEYRDQQMTIPGGDIMGSNLGAHVRSLLSAEYYVAKYFDVFQTYVPEAFRDKTQVPLEAKEWADDWLAGKQRGNLVLCGSVGTRKSTAATIIIRYLSAHYARQGMAMAGPQFVVVSELMRKIKKSFGADDEDPTEEAQRAAALALDDLFRRKSLSEFETETLCAIFDHRSGKRRPTVITTNAYPTLLIKKEEVDLDLASRAFGGATIVEMDGHDWREGAPTE